MSNFFSKTCIALTWNDEGICRGVRLRRHGSRLAIVAHWRNQSGTDDNLAYDLSEGIRVLRDNVDTPVIVGSTGKGFCFVDLAMPSLDSENLRNALRFELHKQAPINQEKLVWGFRVIGSDNQKSLLVRLAYLPEIQWEYLLDRLGGLVRSIDAIMPVPAALDPVLNDTSLFLAEGDDEDTGCLYVPGEQGRELLYPDADSFDGAAFGAGEQPLFLDGLEVGELADLSPSEQRSFAGAVVLAMYGTSGALRSDRKNWFTVPEPLQPKRHRIARRVAVILSFYIGLVLFFGLVSAYIEGVGYVRGLETRHAEISRKIDHLSSRESQGQFVSSMREELGRLDLARPSLLQCLIVITDNTPEEYWVSNLNWQEGRIDLQIQSEKDDLTFLEKLRESPLLADVLPTRKTVDHENRVTFQVQMRTASGQIIEHTLLDDAGIDRSEAP